MINAASAVINYIIQKYTNMGGTPSLVDRALVNTQNYARKQENRFESQAQVCCSVVPHSLALFPVNLLSITKGNPPPKKRERNIHIAYM